jgi:flagellar motor switch/type III secretory pathway protein FliN
MPPPRTIDRVRPFPWQSLQATTRAEVSALRDVMHWAAGHIRLGEFALALERLLGARVEVLIGRAQSLCQASSTRAFDDGVAVILAPAATPDVAHGSLIEAECALAATFVGRALRRPAPTVMNMGVTPSDGIAGAFAAVVLAAARRAHVGIALRVVEAGPAPRLERDMGKLDSELVALSLTVLVDDDAFAARAIVSRNAGPSCASPPWDARTLMALGPTPLGVPIVACATLMTPEELAVLRPGDALVPSAWPFARASNGALEGPVLLAAPLSDLGVRARLCEDDRLVLGAGREALVAPEVPMNSDEKDGVVATLGEVPVVVRVEIGEAVMTAREWASMGRGDVVSLGRRVGGPVLLRVGGVPLARGELVDLEGEVAVRIVERLIGET